MLFKRRKKELPEKKAIEKKAASLGFDTATKVNIDYCVNDLHWDVYVISNKDEADAALGRPIFLMKNEKKIRFADEEETQKIIEMPLLAN